MIAKDLIVKRLEESKEPLAVHQLHIDGYSENNLATRCAELSAEGIIKGHYKVGAHYKVWYLAKTPKFDEQGQGVLL